MGKNRKYTIFIRFLISYMVILIFALTIGVIAHRQTLKVVESEGKNATMGLLKQSKEILNMRLSEIESIVKKLKMIQKFLLLIEFKIHMWAQIRTRLLIQRIIYMPIS